MKASLRLLATLLLLAFVASVAEAAWMGSCPREAATLSAPAGHSHVLPGDAGHGAPANVPASDCPMSVVGHGGCAVASLPASAGTVDLPLSLESLEPAAPDEEHAVLLARDRFHPPRR